MADQPYVRIRIGPDDRLTMTARRHLDEQIARMFRVPEWILTWEPWEIRWLLGLRDEPDYE